jgi:hypothetical protein
MIRRADENVFSIRFFTARNLYAFLTLFKTDCLIKVTKDHFFHWRQGKFCHALICNRTLLRSKNSRATIDEVA